MKRSHIQLLREFLVTQVNYWSFFPVVPTVLILSSGKTGPGMYFNPYFLLLALFPLFFYLVRRHIENALLFLLLHAGPVALAYFLPMPNFVFHICAVVLGAAFTVYSVYLGFCSEEDEDGCLSPLFSVLISAGCLFFLQNYGLGYPSFLFSGLVILILCLYCLILYIDKFFHFLSVNENSAGQIPEKEIFRSGLKQISGFLLGGAAILLTVCNIHWLEYLLGMLKAVLLIPLRFLLKFLLREPETPAQTTMEDLDMDQFAQAPSQLSNREPHWIWEVLLYIVCFLIIAILFFLIVRAIVQMIRMLRTRILRKRNRTPFSDDEYDPESDVRESLHWDRSRQRAENSFFGFLSINERVRRMYRKQAQRLDSNNSKLVRMTARECAGLLESPNIGTIYEKARYSGTDCSSEDLKQMKTACKRAKAPEVYKIGRQRSIYD